MKNASLFRVCWPALLLSVALVGLWVSYPNSPVIVRVLQLSLWPIAWFGVWVVVLRFGVQKRALKGGAWGVAALVWLSFPLVGQQMSSGYNLSRVAEEAPMALFSTIPFAGPLLTAGALAGQASSMADRAAKKPDGMPSLSMLLGHTLDHDILSGVQPCVTGLLFAFTVGLLRWPGRQPLPGEMPAQQEAPARSSTAIDFEAGETVTLRFLDRSPPEQKQTSAATETGAAKGNAAGAVPAQPALEAGANTLWHVLEDDAVRGPFPLAELAARQIGGSLALHAMIRLVGTHHWVPLRAEILRAISGEQATRATASTKTASAASRTTTVSTAPAVWVAAKTHETQELDVFDKCLRVLRGQSPVEPPHTGGTHQKNTEQDALENLLRPLLVAPALLRVLLVLILLGAVTYFIWKKVNTEPVTSATSSFEAL